MRCVGECGIGFGLSSTNPAPLIPANAGIHGKIRKERAGYARLYPLDWIPACAGMSGERGRLVRGVVV